MIYMEICRIIFILNVSPYLCAFMLSVRWGNRQPAYVIKCIHCENQWIYFNFYLFQLANWHKCNRQILLYTKNHDFFFLSFSFLESHLIFSNNIYLDIHFVYWCMCIFQELWALVVLHGYMYIYIIIKCCSESRQMKTRQNSLTNKWVLNLIWIEAKNV